MESTQFEHALAAATEHHQAGRLDPAEALYLQILQDHPDQAAAWHRLGVLQGQRGRAAKAVEFIARAIALKSDVALFHCHQGIFCQQIGDATGAIASGRRAVELDPQLADAWCNLGIALAANRQRDQAIDSYRRAIALAPGMAQAHSNLGCALNEMGQHEAAIIAHRQSIAFNPAAAQSHNNLGIALRDAGRFEEAIAACRAAIDLDPAYAEAYNSLGNALRSHGKLADAAAAHRRAIAIRHDYAEAHSNLGIALGQDGQVVAALESHRHAVALAPASAHAHGNLAQSLRQSGALAEAIAAYQRAVELRPDIADIHNNLAVALRESGELAAAEAACGRALALDDNSAAAWSNLGMIRRDLGALEDAIAAYEQALRRNPNFALAHNNLAVALRDVGQLDAAVDSARRAVALQPNSATALSNLAAMLRNKNLLDDAADLCRRAIAIDPGCVEALNNLGNCLKDQGQLDQAIECFRQALAANPSAQVHSNLLYTLGYHPDATSAQLLAAARQWAALHADGLEADTRPHDNDRSPDRPLRIGYVSADFRRHAAACFLLPLLGHHAAGAVEVFCYSGVVRPDEVTARLRGMATHWRDVASLTDAALANQIRADRIDILVDLTLHMSFNRLLTFARKPAPIQVTWLGYPGTTGLTSIDYRLTDPHLDPPGRFDADYVERSVRLPHSFWCYEPTIDTPEVGPSPAAANGFVTFGCFNNFCKVTAPTLALWAAVLAAAPTSRLILQSQPGSHRERTLAQLAALGVDPVRIEFVGLAAEAQYFQLFTRIDVSLDPIPYPGHTTTLDSLWMGVPVITLAGDTVVSRGGQSILTNAGLTDWIAHSPAQYIAIANNAAAALAKVPALRAGLRDRLRQSPLMNGPQFASDMEAAYRAMWRTWLGGGPAPKRTSL